MKRRPVLKPLKNNNIPYNCIITFLFAKAYAQSPVPLSPPLCRFAFVRAPAPSAPLHVRRRGPVSSSRLALPASLLSYLTFGQGRPNPADGDGSRRAQKRLPLTVGGVRRSRPCSPCLCLASFRPPATLPSLSPSRRRVPCFAPASCRRLIRHHLSEAARATCVPDADTRRRAYGTARRALVIGNCAAVSERNIGGRTSQFVGSPRRRDRETRERGERERAVAGEETHSDRSDSRGEEGAIEGGASRGAVSCS